MRTRATNFIFLDSVACHSLLVLVLLLQLARGAILSRLGGDQRVETKFFAQIHRYFCSRTFSLSNRSS